MPLYPRSVASQGACPNSLFFRCFHFKFTFESIKELGSTLDEASLNKAHERTLSLVAWKKGENKVKMGSFEKIPRAPKKNKGKEKVPEPILESPKHIEFHLFSKSNGDVHPLILLLNGPMKGKGASKPWNVWFWTNFLRSRKRRF